MRPVRAFGLFKLFGGYQHGKDLTAGNANTVPSTGGISTQILSLTLPAAAAPGLGAATNLKAYTIGSSKEFGAATVVLNYTHTQYENAAGSNRTLGRIGLGATYAFSKTTTAYSAVGRHTGSLKEYINEKTVFQLGLRKAFLGRLLKNSECAASDCRCTYGAHFLIPIAF